jgi:hypothetical protein
VSMMIRLSAVLPSANRSMVRAATMTFFPVGVRRETSLCGCLARWTGSRHCLRLRSVPRLSIARPGRPRSSRPATGGVPRALDPSRVAVRAQRSQRGRCRPRRQGCARLGPHQQAGAVAPRWLPWTLSTPYSSTELRP